MYGSSVIMTHCRKPALCGARIVAGYTLQECTMHTCISSMLFIQHNLLRITGHWSIVFVITMLVWVCMCVCMC